MSASPRTAEKRNNRYDSSAEDQMSDNDQEPQRQATSPAPRRRNQRTMQRRQQTQQQSQGPLDQLPLQNLDGVTNTVGNTVGGVTGALGGIGGQQQQQGGGGGKSDTLRLRLDLNLDIEITLKARIHGDLELALLYVHTLIVPCRFHPQHCAAVFIPGYSSPPFPFTFIAITSLACRLPTPPPFLPRHVRPITVQKPILTSSVFQGRADHALLVSET